MKLRKLNRSIHRDLGYIFFFMTLIYGLSGIALNHLDDWNPSYIINSKEFKVDKKVIEESNLSRNDVLKIMDQYAPHETYKSHYSPSENTIKIFIKNGSIAINTETLECLLETTKRRPIFHQVNYLHYNPKKLWTILSDIYAISLLILAISGLFILKGKNGITGRGAWLTAIGIIIPVIFLLIYYWKVF